MSKLFSQKNLLLCGMQGNNGFLAKHFQKFPKSPIWQAGSNFNKTLWERTLRRLGRAIVNAEE